MADHATTTSHCLAQAQLEDLKFFGKPRLGLDAVGGTAAAKLADTLIEVWLPPECFGRFRLCVASGRTHSIFLLAVTSGVSAAMQGGLMVCYGCASGKPPAWPWQSWVFREQQVSGFNLRAWLARNPCKVCVYHPAVMQLPVCSHGINSPQTWLRTTFGSHRCHTCWTRLQTSSMQVCDALSYSWLPAVVVVATSRVCK
jgi:hypothetical protein